MFKNKGLSNYYNINYNEIRSIGNKYSVLLKLRNYIYNISSYDILEQGAFSDYYMDEKDDTIYDYLHTYFFSSSDISLLETIKIPKKLTYV